MTSSPGIKTYFPAKEERMRNSPVSNLVVKTKETEGKITFTLPKCSEGGNNLSKYLLNLSTKNSTKEKEKPFENKMGTSGAMTSLLINDDNSLTNVINDLVPTSAPEPLVTIATDQIAMTTENKYVSDWLNSSNVIENSSAGNKQLKPIAEGEVVSEQQFQRNPSEDENTQQSRRSTRSTAKRAVLQTITR